ncbi:MAG: molybdopterin-synthase adenylyltransferase MoeB [Moraxellaceae bacterium]|nr:molybdopterin-synthase adenylyltransferase MoeB [Moraxellaceae bacterium]
MLNDDELMRYARQIMLPAFDISAQEKLKASRVLVVGMGGIGCPLALYLAAAGVGELLLADFDSIEVSNLQRQFLYAEADLGRLKAEVAAEKLRVVNPFVRVEPVTRALDADTLPSLLARVDLVVDGCDNFTTRDAVNAACVEAGVPLVSAAAIGFGAQLAVFDARRDDSPCYRCLYPDMDEAAATCAEAGILAPVVGVVGALAATEALKMLSGVGEPLVGRLWLWEAMAGMMRTLSVRRDANCVVCGVAKTSL